MALLQWAVWGLAVFVFLGFVFHMRTDARNGQVIHMVTVLQTATMLAFVALFAFEPWNKLHLLWIIPACLPLSLLGFSIFRVPIVGSILRAICLFVGRFFLVGVGGTIRGVPFQQ
jgi:hypothetical protein